MVQIWSKATYKAEYSELGQTPTLRLKRVSQCPLHIQLHGKKELSADEDSVRAAALEITLLKQTFVHCLSFSTDVNLQH